MAYREDLDRLRDAFSFLSAASDIYVGMRAYRWPVLGPKAKELFVHTVWVGPLQAANVLVLISGTHGPEGPAGAEVQCKLLEAQDFLKRLGPNTAVLIIFGLNVWGYVTGRRVEHDGVNPNRGCGPLFTRSIPTEMLFTVGHERYLHYVRPRPLTQGEYLELHELSSTNPVFVRLMTSGQHDWKDGFEYGGTQVCASGRIIEQICRKELQYASKVAVLDIHTGLGDGGVVLSTATTQGAADFTQTWLSGHQVQYINLGPSVSVPMHGTVLQHVERNLPDKRVLAVAVEMGGLGTKQPLAVMLAENCVYHCKDQMNPVFVRRILSEYPRQFFDARNHRWRQQLWKCSDDVITSLLKFLHH